MTERDSARAERRPTAFQRAIALSWFLLAAAWALIAVRTALGGYPSWWQWTLFAILSVGVGLLNLYARRWQRRASRQQNT